MTLKSLINGQKIRIDNHKSGENVSEDISKVHVHKTFVSDHNRKGKFMKIYLDGHKIDYDPRISEDEIPSTENEIKSVLKKYEQKLREFAETVGDALMRWSNSEISLESAKQCAKNIARLFSLKPEIEEELIRQVGDKLMQYISVHKDELDEEYSIDQSAKRIPISPGKFSTQKRYKQSRK